VADLAEPELRQEILRLRRRVQTLAALLRLVQALLQAPGFTLSRERLPDGRVKRRILRTVDQARASIPLRALLRFLGLSPSPFLAWRRRQTCKESFEGKDYIVNQAGQPSNAVKIPTKLNGKAFAVDTSLLVSPSTATSLGSSSWDEPRCRESRQV
jgi:hypothetical protein